METLRDDKSLDPLLKGKDKRIINRFYRKNKKVPFINRILSKDTLQIQDWENPENHATHKLGYVEADGKYYIYPEVQKQGNTLIDYTSSPDKFKGFEEALKNKNVVPTNKSFAEFFTSNYKKSKYFKRYEENMKKVNKFQMGGTMNGLSPLPIWSLFKSSKEIKEEPKKVSKQSQFEPNKSIYEDKIKSNPKFDKRINWDNIDWLQQFFHKNLGYKTSLGILPSVIKESFGNPKIKQIGGGPGYGLLQWEKGSDRYNRMMKYRTDSIIPGVDPELQRQAEFIINTTLDSQHPDDWHHGGKGSGFNTAEDARKAFISRKSSAEEKAYALSAGYVRPKGGLNEAKRRSKMTHSLDSLYNSKYFKMLTNK